MLSFAHTIISLPVGLHLHNPIIIFAAAFVLHLLCDTLPHWNIYPENFRRYPVALAGLDVTAGLLAAWLLLGQEMLTVPVLAAIAGGNTPDFIFSCWYLLKEHGYDPHIPWLARFNAFQDKSQSETDKVLPGSISQIAGIAVAILLIFS